MTPFRFLRNLGFSALLATACASGAFDTEFANPASTDGDRGNGEGGGNGGGGGDEGVSLGGGASAGTSAEAGTGGSDAAAGSGAASGSGGSAAAGGSAGDSGGAAGVPPVGPLCGGLCFPDSPDSCQGFEAGAGAGGAADRDYGCYIRPGPMAVCEEAGVAEVGDDCRAATDCAPGLGCVLGALTGHCRPYCCEGLCAGDEACAALPTAELPPARTTAPFCMPPDICELGDTSCGSGLACMLHANGTTWCERPGAGHSGDECPCAEGFVCAGAESRCRRLCEEDSPGVCGAGLCQAVPTFPAGYGICVDGSDSG